VFQWLSKIVPRLTERLMEGSEEDFLVVADLVSLLRAYTSY